MAGYRGALILVDNHVAVRRRSGGGGEPWAPWLGAGWPESAARHLPDVRGSWNRLGWGQRASLGSGGNARRLSLGLRLC